MSYQRTLLFPSWLWIVQPVAIVRTRKIFDAIFHNTKIENMGRFMNWLFPSPKEKKQDWLEVQRELDNESDRIAQGFEDFRIESHINRAAQDAYFEWMQECKWVQFDGSEKWYDTSGLLMSLLKPMPIYYVHDEKTAKYLKVDIKKLIWDKFIELRNNDETYKHYQKLNEQLCAAQK